MLQVRGAVKSYGGAGTAVAALAGADLEVAPGTVHGLLGSNGAGKTTLLRIVLGLVRPDSGTVVRPVRVGGFVERPGAYPYLSGRDNLRALAALDDDPADVEQVLDRVGLQDRAGSRVAGWSLGMRQRLGIAAGLLRRPDLLVLDEPSNGLDPLGVADLHSLVRDLAADGLAVLLSSHDLPEVDAVCDQLTVLAGGRSVWTGQVQAMRSGPDRLLLRTSDDARALELCPLVQARAEGGLSVRASTAQLDAYVLRLAAHGVAVREMVRQTASLEERFRELVAG